MAAPVRLQLSRRRGFDLQALSRAVNGLEAVNVARPSRFGNPFLWPILLQLNPRMDKGEARAWAVKNFAMWIDGDDFGCPAGHMPVLRQAILAAIPDLRGKNIACHCPVGAMCHGDIYLERANL